VNVPGLLNLLAVGLALGWAALVIYTTHVLARPPRRTYGWAVARGLPGDPAELHLPGQSAQSPVRWSEWTIRSRGLDLPVWDVTGLNPDGPVVVLTHGWADSRVVMLGSGRVAAALPLVSRLVLWDMPGHGDAPGHSTLGAHEPDDLRAIIDRVADGVRPLVLWGFSLGARVSIRAATDHTPVAGVIAEAPYLLPWTPARNVLDLRGLPYRSNLPPAMLILGFLNGRGGQWWPRRTPAVAAPPHSRDALDATPLRCPLLVIHGDADAISPSHDGRTLASQAPHGEFALIPGGEHQTLWRQPETVGAATAALSGFLGRVQSALPAAGPAAPAPRS
jgi:pimeloyl-ACP methyl ester carboxylesterase